MGSQAHPWFRKDWPLLDLEQVNAVRAVMAISTPAMLRMPCCAVATWCLSPM